MKNIFAFFILMSLVTSGLAQEIMLNSKIVSTSGVNSGKSVVNITKWKLGETHTLVINSIDLSEVKSSEWNIKSFPNPFTELLNIQFQTKEKINVTIQITDIQGKETYLEKNTAVLQNQVLQYNLSQLKPAIYLLTVVSKDKNEIKIHKIQKN